MNLNIFKKKQKVSKVKSQTYVSKLGKKRSKEYQDKINELQRKGVKKSFVKRYIDIICSGLNVIRLRRKKTDNVETFDDTEDLYE